MAVVNRNQWMTMSERISLKQWAFGLILSAVMVTPSAAEMSVLSVTRLADSAPRQLLTPSHSDRQDGGAFIRNPNRPVLSFTHVEGRSIRRERQVTEPRRQSTERGIIRQSTQPPAREQSVTRLGNVEPSSEPDS